MLPKRKADFSHVPEDKRLKKDIVDLLASGTIPAERATGLFQNAQASGAKGCEEYAKLHPGEHNKFDRGNHVKRNVLRKALKGNQWPKVYMFQAPIHIPSTGFEPTGKIPVLLPHELLDALHQHNPLESGLFDHSLLDPTPLNHLKKACAQLSADMSKVAGLSIWADGAPYNHDRSKSFEVASLQILTSASTAMQSSCPWHALFSQIFYQAQPSHFVSVKKVKQGEGTLLTIFTRCRISSQKEIQDLLTKEMFESKDWTGASEFYVCLQFLSLQPCSWPWHTAVGSCMQRIALKPVEKVCSLLWALQFLLRFGLTISLAWQSLTIALSSTPLVKLCLWKPARKERLMTLLLNWKPARMLIQLKMANTPGCFGAIECLLWLAPRLVSFIVAKLWWTEWC